MGSGGHSSMSTQEQLPEVQLVPLCIVPRDPPAATPAIGCSVGASPTSVTTA